MKNKLFLAALVLFTALIAVYNYPIVFAAVDNATSTVSTNAQKLADLWNLLEGVVLPALASAIVTTMLGYWKSNTPDSFDPVKFGATILIAAIVSLLTTLGGMSPADIQTWVADGGITIWAYWIAKILLQKIGYGKPALTQAHV